MAKFIIVASACTFSTTESGFKCMRYAPFDPKLYEGTLEAAKVAEIEAEKARVFEQLKAENPARSFFVTAHIASRGERKPNGYNKLQPLNYDSGQEWKEPDPEPQWENASYKIVGGIDRVLTLTPEQLFPALDVRGHPQIGYSTSRAVRKELQGRPTFKGLCGPMFDGTTPEGLPVIRYETPEINEMLSI